MSKYIPYKGERNFNNVFIGAHQRNGTFLNVRFFRPISFEKGVKAEYELCVLRARINGRLTDDKLIIGDINGANGCLGAIEMSCVKKRTPLGITYEKVSIETAPPITEDSNPDSEVCDMVEFDAVYLQVEQTGRRFVIARGEEQLKLVEITGMDENEIENIARLTYPMEASKTRILKRLDADPGYTIETAPTTTIPQETEIEGALKDELVDKPYIVITPDKGVTELSSIIQCVHTQYRLYGTKNDNVEFTLHVTNPHTRDHKSVSFVINKRDNLIVDKHELSFDECVCRINTLLTINTLNKSVVDALFINTHGAFVIQFENDDCIDIDGAKECRVVEGWNNY